MAVDGRIGGHDPTPRSLRTPVATRTPPPPPDPKPLIGVPGRLQQVDHRTRAARRRSRAPAGRVAASTLSFLAEPRRLPYSGWDAPDAVPTPAPPANPSRGRPRTRPRCPAATHPGLASAWPDRWGGCGCWGTPASSTVGDLGALAVDVHLDVHRRRGLLPCWRPEVSTITVSSRP